MNSSTQNAYYMIYNHPIETDLAWISLMARAKRLVSIPEPQCAKSGNKKTARRTQLSRTLRMERNFSCRKGSVFNSHQTGRTTSTSRHENAHPAFRRASSLGGPGLGITAIRCMCSSEYFTVIPYTSPTKKCP